MKRHTTQLMQLPNVVGVGKGRKMVRGEETEDLAVVVLVEKKMPEKELLRGQRIPKTLGQVPTDVIEIGEVRLLNRKSFQRPAHPGVSIGHYKVTAGTFGAVVRDRRSGMPLILSNNHVLANATDGRDGRAKLGDPILQPGSHDGGSMEQVIGYLERFIPLWKEYTTTECKAARAAERLGNRALQLIRPNYRLNLEKRFIGENPVDAAVARPINPEAISPEIIGIGLVKGVTEVKPGMAVQKSGRTTGLNSATVRTVQTTLKVSVTDNDDAIFTDQFVTTVMSQGGDSGSLVLDNQNNAVGLLFAGSSSSTICNRIQNVMELLQIDVYF
ncbi:hypothetical protein SY88_19310 [Clostridiales bacterium PH28_bin88]|nr:hypothetical protein SY88_19310 [Clostridiales bacterium PH28_bin88]